MGNSNTRSNIVGKNGTEKVTNFKRFQGTNLKVTNATITNLNGLGALAFTGNLDITGNASISGKVESGSYVKGTYFKVGAHSYIFTTSAGVAATMLAAATAIDAAVDTSIVFADAAMYLISGPATINLLNATALT